MPTLAIPEALTLLGLCALYTIVSIPAIHMTSLVHLAIVCVPIALYGGRKLQNSESPALVMSQVLSR